MNKKNKTIEFSKLNCGEVFKLDEIIYMNKQQVVCSNGNRLNTANLISGKDREIGIATLVIPLSKS